MCMIAYRDIHALMVEGYRVCMGLMCIVCIRESIEGKGKV